MPSLSFHFEVSSTGPEPARRQAYDVDAFASPGGHIDPLSRQMQRAVQKADVTGGNGEPVHYNGQTFLTEDQFREGIERLADNTRHKVKIHEIAPSF